MMTLGFKGLVKLKRSKTKDAGLIAMAQNVPKPIVIAGSN